MQRGQKQVTLLVSIIFNATPKNHHEVHVFCIEILGVHILNDQLRRNDNGEFLWTDTSTIIPKLVLILFWSKSCEHLVACCILLNLKVVHVHHDGRMPLVWNTVHEHETQHSSKTGLVNQFEPNCAPIRIQEILQFQVEDYMLIDAMTLQVLLA